MLKDYNFYSQDIAYLKADANYTEFYLTNGRKIVSSSTLKRYEADERLKDFLRVNKSYLINQEYISQYRANQTDIIIYLINGYKIKVARRRRIAIRNRLNAILRIGFGD